MVTKIYLVRHAHAKGNEERFLQGCLDTPLSSKGKSQLEDLKIKFKGRAIDKIYSSDLERARLTAMAIKSVSNFNEEIILKKELREMFFGSLEGEKISRFYGEFKALSDVWDNNPKEFASPKGESMREVYDRLGLALDEIVSQNKGKTIAIVSHGCAIRNICARFLGGIGYLGITPWVKHSGYAVLTLDENNSIIDFSDCLGGN